MDVHNDIEQRAGHLTVLIEEKIGPRGPDLLRQVRKAGRRLPRAVRRDVELVARASEMVRHPKLARQVFVDEALAASDRARAFLEKVDPADRRLGVLLSWLGDNAFNLLIVAALLIVVLRWQGLI